MLDADGQADGRIQNSHPVLDCYVMTGNTDYLLCVLAESLNDYERFVLTELHAVEGIASIDTSFAYGHVKRATVLPAIRKRHDR